MRRIVLMFLTFIFIISLVGGLVGVPITYAAGTNYDVEFGDPNTNNSASGWVATYLCPYWVTDNNSCNKTSTSFAPGWFMYLISAILALALAAMFAKIEESSNSSPISMAISYGALFLFFLIFMAVILFIFVVLTNLFLKNVDPNIKINALGSMTFKTVFGLIGGVIGGFSAFRNAGQRERGGIKVLLDISIGFVIGAVAAIIIYTMIKALLAAAGITFKSSLLPYHRYFVG
jgi:hypothetical protein